MGEPFSFMHMEQRKKVLSLRRFKYMQNESYYRYR